MDLEIEFTPESKCRIAKIKVKDSTCYQHIKILREALELAYETYRDIVITCRDKKKTITYKRLAILLRRAFRKCREEIAGIETVESEEELEAEEAIAETEAPEAQPTRF